MDIFYILLACPKIVVGQFKKGILSFQGLHSSIHINDSIKDTNQY